MLSDKRISVRYREDLEMLQYIITKVNSRSQISISDIQLHNEVGGDTKLMENRRRRRRRRLNINMIHNNYYLKQGEFLLGIALERGIQLLRQSTKIIFLIRVHTVKNNNNNMKIHIMFGTVRGGSSRLFK